MGRILRIIFCLCVAKVISGNYGDNPTEKRLIKTGETDPGRWLTQDEILNLVKGRIKFVDVTDLDDTQTTTRSTTRSQQDESEAAIGPSGLPKSIRFKGTVQSLFPHLSIARVETFMKKFSSFFTRYYTSRTGVDSQRWLLAQVQQVIQSNGKVTSVKEFKHSGWNGQQSVICRIEGSDPLLKKEVVILGAHQDSINLRGPGTLRAPGADDNGSGSAVVLETLRVLMESGFNPKRSVEFHWYAAEEVGLRGSSEIAKSYKKDKVNVVGLVNFDVSGYQVAQTAGKIAIIEDYTSPALNKFLRLLTKAYLTYQAMDDSCGYGCSDHYSWTLQGYPAACPSEPVPNPDMHTVRDTMDQVNLTQVMEFVKLAGAFVVETAEPS